MLEVSLPPNHIEQFRYHLRGRIALASKAHRVRFDLPQVRCQFVCVRTIEQHCSDRRGIRIVFTRCLIEAVDADWIPIAPKAVSDARVKLSI